MSISGRGQVSIVEHLMKHARENHGERIETDSNFSKLLKMMDTTGGLVKSLVELHENRPAEMSEEAHRAKVLRAASKLSKTAGTARAEFEAFRDTTEKAFISNMVEHSGLRFSALAGEVRRHALSLPVNERVLLVQDLIKSGDSQSLAALIHPDVPAFLAGFTGKEQAKLREQHFATVLPDAVKTKEAFRDMADHADQLLKTAEGAAHNFGNESSLRVIDNVAADHARAEKNLQGGE